MQNRFFYVYTLYYTTHVYFLFCLFLGHNIQFFSQKESDSIVMQRVPCPLREGPTAPLLHPPSLAIPLQSQWIQCCKSQVIFKDQ